MWKTLFLITVCDVLPHLLASDNMTVDIANDKGPDRQEEEVCNLSI